MVVKMFLREDGTAKQQAEKNNKYSSVVDVEIDNHDIKKVYYGHIHGLGYINAVKEYDGVELDYFEKNNISTSHNRGLISDNIKNEGITYTEMIDTVVNDIPLRIYKPHNAVMSLHHGPIDLKDSTIVYVAQAADIRADNGNIVGDFYDAIYDFDDEGVAMVVRNNQFNYIDNEGFECVGVVF